MARGRVVDLAACSRFGHFATCYLGTKPTVFILLVPKQPRGGHALRKVRSAAQPNPARNDIKALRKAAEMLRWRQNQTQSEEKVAQLKYGTKSYPVPHVNRDFSHYMRNNAKHTDLPVRSLALQLPPAHAERTNLLGQVLRHQESKCKHCSPGSIVTFTAEDVQEVQTDNCRHSSKYEWYAHDSASWRKSWRKND